MAVFLFLKDSQVHRVAGVVSRGVKSVRRVGDFDQGVILLTFDTFKN